MSKKQKRLNIFRYASKAISKYYNDNVPFYYCPICCRRYPESSAISGKELTLEHVPPLNAGGKAILLTCRDCNSLAGYTIDVCTASKGKFEKFERIMLGQDKGDIPPLTTLTLGEDIKVQTSVSRKNFLEIRPLGENNSPNTLNKYKEYLINHSHNLQFDVSISAKYDERLFKLSYLKAAFLLVFAWLGYSYAFDQRLDIVRNQIREPNKNILGTRFWIEGNGKIPLNKIMFLRQPLPIYLVSFNNFAIILPSLESPRDIYGDLSTYWERGQKVNFQVRINSWPDNLQMKLDFQY